MQTTGRRQQKTPKTAKDVDREFRAASAGHPKHDRDPEGGIRHPGQRTAPV